MDGLPDMLNLYVAAKERMAMGNDKNIVFRKVADLVLLKCNPRKITKTDFARLCDSIKTNGFWIHRPIALSDRTGDLVIIAGNQRLKAAKYNHLEVVPTILYHNLTVDEENEIIFRDNINNGDWDTKKMNKAPFEGVDFDNMGLAFDLDSDPGKSKKKNTKKGLKKKKMMMMMKMRKRLFTNLCGKTCFMIPIINLIYLIYYWITKQDTWSYHYHPGVQIAD
jgi:hypothetical protein